MLLILPFIRNLARDQPRRCQRRVGVNGVAQMGSRHREPRVHGPVHEAIRPHALRPVGQGVVPAHRERERRRLDPELTRDAIVKSAEPSLAGLAGMLAPFGPPNQAGREKIAGPTEEWLAVSRAGPAHDPPSGSPRRR